MNKEPNNTIFISSTIAEAELEEGEGFTNVTSLLEVFLRALSNNRLARPLNSKTPSIEKDLEIEIYGFAGKGAFSLRKKNTFFGGYRLFSDSSGKKLFSGQSTKACIIKNTGVSDKKKQDLHVEFLGIYMENATLSEDNNKHKAIVLDLNFTSIPHILFTLTPMMFGYCHDGRSTIVFDEPISEDNLDVPDIALNQNSSDTVLAAHEFILRKMSDWMQDEPSDWGTELSEQSLKSEQKRPAQPDDRDTLQRNLASVIEELAGRYPASRPPPVPTNAAPLDVSPEAYDTVMALLKGSLQLSHAPNLPPETKGTFEALLGALKKLNEVLEELKKAGVNVAKLIGSVGVAIKAVEWFLKGFL